MRLERVGVKDMVRTQNEKANTGRDATHKRDAMKAKKRAHKQARHGGARTRRRPVIQATVCTQGNPKK